MFLSGFCGVGSTHCPAGGSMLSGCASTVGVGVGGVPDQQGCLGGWLVLVGSYMNTRMQDSPAEYCIKLVLQGSGGDLK